MWKTQEHMQQHILKLRRNVLTLGATRQTGVDGYNARTISRLIKTIKTDIETNCPTHFLRTHTRKGNVCVCVMCRASWVSSGPEHTETAVVLKRTWLETHCQIITLPHTHTQSLSLTYTTHKIPQVHHTNTNLDSCQATLYEDMVK